MNLSGLGTYALLSFTSLIAIVNPLMSAPLYLALGWVAVAVGVVVLLLSPFAQGERRMTPPKVW